MIQVCCRGRRCRPREAVSFPYRFPINFHYVRVRAGRKPVRQRILARDVRIQRIRIPSCNDLVENVPDHVAISVGGRANFHYC
jgi:hypothetical protein